VDGRAVVVFVRDDCPHCHYFVDSVMPAAVSMNGHDGRPLTVISIGQPFSDTGASDTLGTVSWMVDPTGRWQSALRIISTPTVLVVDSLGSIISSYVGMPSVGSLGAFLGLQEP
jgi:hypothetical protein